MLTAQERAMIDAEVAAAQAASRGHIACVVVEQSGDYVEVALVWAAAAALILPVLPLAIVGVAPQLGVVLPAWTTPLTTAHFSLATTLTAYVIVQCVVFVLAFALFSLRWIRHRMTPLAIVRGRVRHEATKQFKARGLDRLEDRAGILILVSLAERQVEIIADEGIDSRVASGEWARVVEALAAQVRDGRAEEGLVEAIESCCEFLRGRVPGRSVVREEVLEP